MGGLTPILSAELPQCGIKEFCMTKRPWGKRARNVVSDEQIVASYQRTHSGNATAKELGINWKTVYAALERGGIERTGLAIYRHNAALADEEQCRELRAKYEQGLTIAEISRQSGLKPLAVRSALRRAGVKVKRMLPFATPEEEEQIVALFKQGMSRYEISNQIGHSYPLIDRILYAHGFSDLNRNSGPEHHK